MFMISLVLVLAALYVFRNFYNGWLERRAYMHFPGPPLGTFFYKIPKELRSRKPDTVLQTFCNWVELYGPTFAFCMGQNGHSIMVFTVDVDNLKHILNAIGNFTKDFDAPIRKYYSQRLTGGQSILSASAVDQVWFIKRKAYIPFFAKNNMPTLFTKLKPLLDRVVATHISSKIKPGQKNIVDVHEQLGTVFSAIPSVFGFDSEMSNNSPDEIARRMNHFLDVVQDQLAPGPVSQFIKTLKASNQDQTIITKTIIVETRAIAKEMVTKKRFELTIKDLESDDLLGHLINANDLAGFGDDHVVDDIMVIWFVVDNMAKLLGALFITLSNKPDIMDKLKAEIRANPITDFESLAKLVYIDQVLLEILRLNPALQRGLRTVKSGTQLGKYWLPEKSTIIYSEYVQHRNPAYFKDPLDFNPDRWGPGSEPCAPYTFFPFLGGPRACPGKHLAMMAMKLTLSTLLANLDMYPVPEYEGKSPKMNHFTAVLRIHDGPFYDLQVATKLPKT